MMFKYFFPKTTTKKIIKKSVAKPFWLSIYTEKQGGYLIIGSREVFL